MTFDQVAVRVLSHTDRVAYLDHLMRLDGRERALRFSAGVDDSFVMAHCLRLVGSGTTLIGAFAGEMLRGACEIDGDSAFEAADLVVTVEKAWRGKGLGRALAAAGIAEAARLGYAEVALEVPARDQALTRIAECLGFRRQGWGACARWVRSAALSRPISQGSLAASAPRFALAG